jgi:ribosomal-protein-alanine N-acetyltransferase
LRKTAEQLLVRGATRADLDAVVALEAISFPVPWKREFFAQEFDAMGRFNIVATTEGGELVGYVFAMHFLDEMHVNKIAIAPPWRRQGAAVLLMDACFSFAQRNHVSSVSLEVRESNEAARALYRSLDFEESYTRPRYYPDGESAVVMTCAVGPGDEVA